MQDWFVIYRLICMKHTDKKWSDREENANERID